MRYSYKYLKVLTIYSFLFITFIQSINALDIKNLIRDTQKIIQSANEMNMVWWIPTEFWQETFKRRSQISEQEKKNYLKAINKYSLFAVLSAYIGPTGEIFAKDAELLLKNIELRFNDKKINLVDDSKIAPQVQELLMKMKPLMTKMLGQFGYSLEFILFENSRDGKKIMDPKQEGEMDFDLIDKNFHWKLPLSSLMPKKIDSKTKQEFPGDYNYNPYNGNKLQKLN